jgi:hypothetical protein
MPVPGVEPTPANYFMVKLPLASKAMAGAVWSIEVQARYYAEV